MGKDQEEVRQQLGGEVVDLILDVFEDYTMTEQNMKDITYGFSKKIGGNHPWRLQKNPNEPVGEMPQILEDWLNQVKGKGFSKACENVLQKNLQLETAGQEDRKQNEDLLQ